MNATSPGKHVGANRQVLCLNSGSSSLKFGLYEARGSNPIRVLSGEARTLGPDGSSFTAMDADKRVVVECREPLSDPGTIVGRIAELMAGNDLPAPDAIGHRVVHGGPSLLAHGSIDAEVMTKLQSALSFAPLHGPASLAGIYSAQARFPVALQYACYDTVFHAGLPDVARVLPIPGHWQQEGLHRYGFHGLSCESILQQLGDRVPERLVIAHLGNGVSVTAIRNGKSIDTSMGLTPNGGTMMGTRSGDLDPGLLLYLMRVKQLDSLALEEMLDHRSGLLGVSGLSSDMRELQEAAGSSPSARLAIQMFCYGLRKQIAGMMAVLGGIDLLVFTGGIGEHDACVRAEICEGLRWAGARLQPAANRAHAQDIGAADSAFALNVLPSREDQQIARHVVDFMLAAA